MQLLVRFRFGVAFANISNFCNDSWDSVLGHISILISGCFSRWYWFELFQLLRASFASCMAVIYLPQSISRKPPRKFMLAITEGFPGWVFLASFMCLRG